MARIRSIRPDEVCKGEALAGLPWDAEAHLHRLMTYADDVGRGVDNPRLIKGECWPLDDRADLDQITAWMDACVEHGLLSRYEVGGVRYFEFTAWSQKPQHPAKSTIPEPPIGSSLRRPHEGVPPQASEEEQLIHGEVVGIGSGRVRASSPQRSFLPGTGWVGEA